MTPFWLLTPEARRALAAALRSNRLAPPFESLSVRRYTGEATCKSVAAELERLSQLGMSPAHVAEALAMLDDGPPPSPPAALVWSGPEGLGTTTRDTGVVVRELFARARRRVLLAGFAVRQGHDVFRELARRLDNEPAFHVQMFLNIERRYGDQAADGAIVGRYVEEFRHNQWPGRRLPELFYDPRALMPYMRGEKRASLHAKCVLADETDALVTSANFTEAAQERNFEVGVLVVDQAFGRALRHQFDELVRRGAMRRLDALTPATG